MRHTPYERHIAAGRIQVGSAYVTGREYQVMALYAEGKTPSEVAQQLRVSKKTLYTHLQNVRERLNAKTIYQTIAMFVVAETERNPPVIQYPSVIVGANTVTGASESKNASCP